MKDIAKMRLGVLKEIKNARAFFDAMEKCVKSKDPEAVQKAYILLVNLVYLMDNGCLTPASIALDLELAKLLREQQ